MQLPAHQRKHAEFEDTRHQHYEKVWALVYGILGDRDAAYDITDDVFRRYWMQLAGGTEIRNVLAWLRKVGRNLALAYRRSAFRRNGTQGPEIMNTIVGNEPSPMESMQHVERFQKLAEAVNSLPPHYAEVIRLRFYEGLTPKGIAALRATSVATVNGQLRRALESLRESLCDEDDGTPENLRRRRGSAAYSLRHL
jgi:RNA polymerase sigma-70 factor (ECF subfamily)